MAAPSETDLVDIVDEFDEKIGTAPRGQVRSAGANFRVDHIFVLDSEHRLLLQQLGLVRTINPGLWGSSVAAHLHAGETYTDAAKRRLSEELGIDAEPRIVAKVAMRENNCLKFIGLYEVFADEASIKEPDHTAAIKFESLDEVTSRIEKQPSSFTPTFRFLFDIYRVVSNA